MHTDLIPIWKAEEEIAYIHGWDFSHIDGRYTEQDDLPWDYRAVIGKHLHSEMKVLDIDTGGGEFLLSLNHPRGNTSATENYPPNVALCKEILLPLGIDFRPGDGKGKLPFDDGSFDLVINRHGDFNPEEIYRVLKPGGIFITQQVGVENDRELVALLCGETEMPFPEQYLSVAVRQFEDAGFRILKQDECFRPIRFFDVGALVWFARIIQKVNIRFSNHLANVVIDRFGKDIQMFPDDEKHFTIHTDIEVSPQFFGWVCGLGKAVRILAPAEVVEEMGEYVRGIAEMY